MGLEKTASCLFKSNKKLTKTELNKDRSIKKEMRKKEEVISSTPR